MNNPLNIVKTESCSTGQEQGETEHVYKVQWEGPQCYIDGQLFYPKIAPSDAELEDKYNTIVISLDGQTKSELKWEQRLEAADRYVEKGYKILWSIDLGLFDRLPFSLLNKSQLMTLSIAIEHFLDNVWPKYEDVTIGVSLYQGSLDFSQAIPWNDDILNDFRQWLKESYETVESLNEEAHLSLSSLEEVNEVVMADTEALHLYSADVCVNYLDIIAGRIPQELACFALIDASPISSPLLQARMLSTERAEHIRFVIKNSLLTVQDISWDASTSPYGYYHSGADKRIEVEKPPLGVCLPELAYTKSVHYQGIEEVMDLLIENDIPFRVIPEALLTTEWDGLDELIVAEPGVSTWGLRKLQGFCAAGGTVVTIGNSLDLVEEMSFSEWQNLHKM